MTIANVSLLNTFDQWRIITNQAIYAVNDIENNNLFYVTSNTASLQVTGNVMRTGTVTIETNLVTSVADRSTTNIASANLVNTVAESAFAFTNNVSTFANTLNVALVGAVINTNAAFTRTNSVYNAVNTVFIVTNAAFSFANSINAFVVGATQSANNWTNAQVLIVDTKATNAYDKSNDAYTIAIASGGNAAANIAILQNNFSIINLSFNTANAAFDKTNSAFAVANAAFDSANNVAPQVAPSFNTANAAFNKANTVASDLANTAVGANGYAVTVGAASNLWANIVGVRANTWANAGIIAAFTVANSAYDTANGISTNTTAAFGRTNAVYTLVNAAYTAANTAVTDFSPAFNTANGAYTVANAAFGKANSVNTLAVAAFEQANADYLLASAAYNQANSALATSVAAGTLTDQTTIAWNISQYQIATVTLGGSRAIGNPTGKLIGTYILHVYQDATGGRTLTWNTAFKWPSGVTPVLSTAAGAHDVFSFICDGTNLYGSYMYDVK